MTRVADPGYPNSIKAVGAQPDQYEAVFTGKAYDDPELAAKLASPQGQAKIAEAMKKLQGRTEFKGTSMYQYMGESDIKFSSRGNFYHYASQKAKSLIQFQNLNQLIIGSLLKRQILRNKHQIVEDLA